jgi:hypothetical protein
MTWRFDLGRGIPAEPRGDWRRQLAARLRFVRHVRATCKCRPRPLASFGPTTPTPAFGGSPLRNACGGRRSHPHHMLARLAAMRQDDGIDAHGFFQGVGQQRVAVEGQVADAWASSARFAPRVSGRHRGGPPDRPRGPTRRHPVARGNGPRHGRRRDVGQRGRNAGRWPPKQKPGLFWRAASHHFVGGFPVVLDACGLRLPASITWPFFILPGPSYAFMTRTPFPLPTGRGPRPTDYPSSSFAACAGGSLEPVPVGRPQSPGRARPRRPC